MSQYFYCKWLRSPIDSPDEMYSELDAARMETRKIEIYKGGRIGYASKGTTKGGTRLAIVPIPSLQKINAQADFQAWQISQEEFEKKWREAKSGHVSKAEAPAAAKAKGG